MPGVAGHCMQYPRDVLLRQLVESYRYGVAWGNGFIYPSGAAVAGSWDTLQLVLSRVSYL